ncbi:MAG: amidohydrolase family protein [Verrucomicrobia bacterium]|nr:amidohydrolase family protein [Verrucomicrobiota bacterium]
MNRLCLSLGLAAAVLSAQASSLLLKDGWIFTASGPVLTNASVLIRDGRIEKVGAGLTDKADTVVELGGQRVFPGLIAPTTVLGLLEIDALRATRDTTEVGEYSADVSAWIAVNPDSELIPVARANGYTHAHVVPSGGTVSGFSGLIQLDGWTIEDLTVEKAVALHLRWPGFGLDTTPRPPGKDSGPSLEDQVRDRDRKLREIDSFFTEAAAYSEAKKVAKEGFKTVPAWEAMLPIVRKERPLWIHVNEARGIRSAAEWSVRRGFKAVIAGGRDAWREAAYLAEHRIPVAYEHVFTQPVRDTDPYDVHYSAPAVLSKAGVLLAFSEGTEQFGASNIRNIPYSAAQARAFGLPYEDAVRGLTLNAAKMLGVSDRLGSIEPGKEATLFIADGDVLDLKAQVKRMWIRGREVDLSSRHTRLYEKYRKRPSKQ